MKNKTNIITILVLIAIGLSACGGIPGNLPFPDGNAAPAQEQPSQPSQVQAPQSSDPASQSEVPVAIEALFGDDSGSGASEAVSSIPGSVTYPIVDTNQVACYSDSSSISCPGEGGAFYGQDGNYSSNTPQYQDNGDGTVSDLVTGLMWTQSPDLNGDGNINVQDKLSFDDAQAYAKSLTLAGYDDWRVPTIKELYSLIDFSGATGTGNQDYSSLPADAVPYIDTDYFDFGYGDMSAGERYIDAQFATSTKYVSTTMVMESAGNGVETMFGVNFADGRIKGYGLTKGNGGKTFYVLFVRGASSYGVNDFVDNGNSTITDNATGLTWMQSDSGAFGVGDYGNGSLNWEQALNWCESLDYAGSSDWRLPDIKELHSIVDYSRSPDTSNFAAIDPLFQATYLPSGVNNIGVPNYAHYWSSTTHLDGRIPAARAAYIAFGEAQGVIDGNVQDVHGAGAQRSDQKSGDPSQLPVGQGPQGDVQSIYNYVRCVTGNSVGTVQTGGTVDSTSVTQPAQAPTGQSSQGQQGPQAGGQPPQEAIDACSSLSQGAACTINTPKGTLTGTCTTVQSGQLACVPEGGPPAGQQP